MADSQGRRPGDPGYDAGDDKQNTDNGDGTYTDGQGNVMDSGGGLITPGPGDNSGGGGSGNSPAPGEPGGPFPVGSGVPGNLPPAPTPTGVPDNGPGTPSTPSTPGSPSPSTPGAPSQPGAPGPSGPAGKPAPNLGASLDQLLAALGSGNQAAAAEAAREFNATFGLDQSKFQESIRQYNQNFGLQSDKQSADIAAQAAGLTGWYNPPASSGGAGGSGWQPPTQDQYVQARTAQLQGLGQSAAQAQQTASAEWTQGLPQKGNVAYGLPSGISFTAPAASGGGSTTGNGTRTLAGVAQDAQLSGTFNGAPTEAAREFNANLGNDLLKEQATLQGDPFKQQQYINGTSAMGYSNAIDALKGVGNQPAFQAPTGTSAAASATLAGAMDRIQNGSGSSGAARATNAAGMLQPGGQWITNPDGSTTYTGGVTPEVDHGNGNQPSQGSTGQFAATGPGGAGFAANGVNNYSGSFNPGSSADGASAASASGGDNAQMQASLDALPAANKIVGRNFLKEDPTTQQFVLSGESAKTGESMDNIKSQIQAGMPTFDAPTGMVSLG